LTDREEEAERDRRRETVANKVDAELDPGHEVVEESFALGLDLVDTVVEASFVTGDEVDEDLDGSAGQVGWLQRGEVNTVT
jgi:hypothetical protein